MKLRGYFYILAIFLFVIFGITFYETLNSFSWKAVTIEALIWVTLGLGYLVFFYGKTVRPLHETRTNSLHGRDGVYERIYISITRPIQDMIDGQARE